ncbi:uncharacterized protein [Argopecten irradians]|uniref:uncharacterized protein n=1 Tax=Argopecten irradians TaxID=31199 RepID=UPI003722BF50
MMDRSFLLFVATMGAMQQGPALYWDLMCVEPDPGFAVNMFNYLTSSEPASVCPASADILSRVGTEMFWYLVCVLMSLLLVSVCSIGKSVKRKWSGMVSRVQEWRARPSPCRHCGTAPCLVERRALWKPSGPGKKSEANFAERSKAMLLFNCGLELSTDLTKELPQDDLYWERKSCDSFEEEQMVLFPKCIRRQIDYWYPVPR